MAPRNYAQRPSSPAHKLLGPSTTNSRARVTASGYRSGRNGTITQLESVSSKGSTRSRRSPTSKGNLILAALDDIKLPNELAILRSLHGAGSLEPGQKTRFIPSRGRTFPSLVLVQVDDETQPQQVTSLLENIIDYFQKWSQEDLVEGPDSIFKDMALINQRVDDILGLPQQVIAAAGLSQQLTNFKIYYETFVQVWSQAVCNALINKLEFLQAQLQLRHGRRLTATHELEFTLFASEIAAVAPSYALQAVLGLSYENTPFLVSELAAEQLFGIIEHLLSAYQAATYDTETKELWLLIWRSLKTAFVAFERGGAPSSPTNTLRDRNFFANPANHRELKRLVFSGEASNPRAIEEIVGRYCQYIHQCQVDPANKYESLQRNHDTPLGTHTKNSLNDFIDTGKFETSTLSKLHFAVARFNHINGGPARIRRWRYGRDNGVWEIIALEPFSPFSSTQTSPAFQNFEQAAESIQSAEQKTTRRIFPYPEGLDIPSAFDYVWYPFPETRAHEIVQSEQITREMTRPGIESEGPRPELLTNRPPRHARFLQDDSKSRLEPLSWIFGVAKQLVWPDRPSRSGKVPTSRRVLPMRNHDATPSYADSTILDEKARIHKLNSLNKSPKLRGGGPPSPYRLREPIRRRHFNASLYHEKMIRLVICKLKAKYGRNVFIDEAQILGLLVKTGYDVNETVVKYTAPGRSKSFYSLESTVRDLGLDPSMLGPAANQDRTLEARFQREKIDTSRLRELQEEDHLAELAELLPEHLADIYRQWRVARMNTSPGIQRTLDHPHLPVNPPLHLPLHPPLPINDDLPVRPDDGNASSPIGSDEFGSSNEENRTPENERVLRAIAQQAVHELERRPLVDLDLGQFTGIWEDPDLMSPEFHGDPTSPPLFTPSPPPPRECHPCPKYEGEYHHACRGWACPVPIHRDPSTPAHSPRAAPLSSSRHSPPNNASAADDDGFIYVGSHDGSDEEEENNQDYRSSPQNQRSRNSPASGRQNQSPRNSPSIGRGGHNLRGGDLTPDGTESRGHETSRDQDGNTVEDIFGDNSTFFAGLDTLDAFQLGPMTVYFNILVADEVMAVQAEGKDRSAEYARRAPTRRSILSNIAQVEKALDSLCDEYLMVLDPSDLPFVDVLGQLKPRSERSKREYPAIFDILVQHWNEVKYYCAECVKFGDFKHPRTNLGLRHAFNRFVVAVREFRSLFVEYHKSIDKSEAQDPANAESSDEEDEEEDEVVAQNQNNTSPKPAGSRPTGTAAGVSNTTNNAPANPASGTPPRPQPAATTPAQNNNAATSSPSGSKTKSTGKSPKSKAPPKLPTRAEYEKMFIPELARELTNNRGFPDVQSAIDKKNPRKSDYIDRLMELDQEGNLGAGSTEGYRFLSGNEKARGAPKSWNLQAAVDEYKEKQKNAEKDGSQAGSGKSGRLQSGSKSA